MRKQIKGKLPLFVISFALVTFGFGIQGNAATTPQDIKQETTVKTEVNSDTSTTPAEHVTDSKSDDSVSYQDANDNQVQPADRSASSDNDGTSVDSDSNHSDTQADNSDSSESSAKDTPATQTDSESKATDNANEAKSAKDDGSVNNSTSVNSQSVKASGVISKAIDSKDDSSTKTPFQQAMIGIGKPGATTQGSSVDDVLEAIINQVIPNDQPASSQPAATTPQSQNSVSGNPPAATGVSSVNPSQFPVNQSKIEKPVTGKAISKPNLEDAIIESDGRHQAKSKTKLVTFDTFSDSFYKTVKNNNVNRGRLTTTNGDKVTITTPVSNAKYLMHDKTGVSDLWPLIATVAVIGLAGLSFFAFDPLRFLFK